MVEHQVSLRVVLSYDFGNEKRDLVVAGLESFVVVVAALAWAFVSNPQR